MARMGNGWSVVALLVGLAAPLTTFAQGQPGAEAGWGRGGRQARLFDPGTVTTVRGEIVEVQRIPRGRRGEGVHVIVATADEKLPIHLGPSFFVDSQSLKLSKGDQVEVTGSRIAVGGAPAVIAQEIKRGGETMSLRDANGVPRWAGAGRQWR